MKSLDESLVIDTEKGFTDNGIYQLAHNFEDEDVVYIELFGTKYLATYTNLDQFGWQVVILVDNTRLLPMEFVFIIILVIIGILIYLTSLLLNKRIRRIIAPIHTILESLEEIKNGNYSIQVNLIENNEIKEIGDSINLMSKEIDRQVKLVYETFAFDALTGLKNISAAKLDINKNVLSGNKKSAICVFQVENIKNINI